MQTQSLQGLLDDARLVLDYAVRAAKLPDNSLSEAVQHLQHLPVGAAPELAEFQRALNAALVAIAPMTLVDLRAGRSPFDERNIKGRKRWQVGLSGATLALIASIAYYQYLVQLQDTVLRAYQEVQEARASEKITAARKFAQQGNALAQNSCNYDAYQRARHELRLLANRSVIVTTTLHELAQSSAWPFGDEVLGLRGWLAGIVGEAHAGLPPAPSAAAAPAPAVAAEADNKAAADAPAGGPRIDDLCSINDAGSAVSASAPWLKQVVVDLVDEFCFASKLSVDYLVGDAVRGGDYFRDKRDPVPVIQQRIRVQTGWLLPFLYGLLGACVYVMRRLLFDAQAAAVEHLVILLRLALGALAGVVIGWFAGPPASAAGAAIAQVSTLPYVLAFLAGFSIDNLFTLLDRANAVLAGKPKAAEPG